MICEFCKKRIIGKVYIVGIKETKSPNEGYIQAGMRLVKGDTRHISPVCGKCADETWDEMRAKL
jgi:hypothetical protein